MVKVPVVGPLVSTGGRLVGRALDLGDGLLVLGHEQVPECLDVTIHPVSSPRGWRRDPERMKIGLRPSGRRRFDLELLARLSVGR